MLKALVEFTNEAPNNVAITRERHEMQGTPNSPKLEPISPQTGAPNVCLGNCSSSWHRMVSLKAAQLLLTPRVTESASVSME